MELDATKKTSYTFELSNDQQELLLGLMVNGNFRKREVPYSLYSIEGEKFNATLYAKEKHGKRKLCVQGSGAQDFVEFQLVPTGVVSVEFGYEDVLHPEVASAHAGSDESGKGDYFGPLVVCCAYVDETILEGMKKFTYLDSQNRIRKLEVKDCKQMSDAQVLMAGASLRRLLGPSGYAVVKLGPAAYNRLYAKIKNINAGCPESAMAGALTLTLGGPAYYGGRLQDRPMLGDFTRQPEIRDVSLSQKAVVVSSVICAALACLIIWCFCI